MSSLCLLVLAAPLSRSICSRMDFSRSHSCVLILYALPRAVDSRLSTSSAPPILKFNPVVHLSDGRFLAAQILVQNGKTRLLERSVAVRERQLLFKSTEAQQRRQVFAHGFVGGSVFRCYSPTSGSTI